MPQVRVIENVLKLNDEVATMNRRDLDAVGVCAIDLIGGPGCGKTALLEATCQRLRDTLRLGVLVGDLTTQRDAERLARHCAQVVQINTGKGCHLEAHQVRQGMEQVDLNQLDLLVIENVGNLICPVGFDLGQDVKVGMFSLAEGDDKPAKHPYLVHAADLILLNKMDLAPYVPFDQGLFDEDVHKLNENVSILRMAVSTGDGLDAWCDWLAAQVKAKAERRQPPAPA